MHPYLLQSNELTIASYPFFYGLALVISCIIFGLLLRATTVPFTRAVNLWFIIAVMIVVGGRVLHALLHGSSTDSLHAQFVAFESGGEVLYGALGLAILTGWFVARRWGLPVGATLDAGAVSAPIGIAIGRIGCLMEGCCHGKVTDGGFLALHYPKIVDVEGHIVGSPAFLRHVELNVIRLSHSASAPVHPVPIYESIVCLLLALLLFTLWRAEKLKGQLLLTMVGCYCTWRFCIEFLRVHERNSFGLTVYQTISLIFGIASFAAMVVFRRRSVARKVPQ